MTTGKKLFRKHECAQQTLIAPVDLQEGYQGKILLVRIVGGKAHGNVCLRSGDEWHREILQKTKREIQDLGFEDSHVVPVGGAWVRFEKDTTVVVYGSSDEFGDCNKKTAAALISSAFPGRQIIVRP
jgi:hypothetical protein